MDKEKEYSEIKYINEELKGIARVALDALIAIVGCKVKLEEPLCTE